jgi:phosphoenolpyruvate carboxykinase (GTP)
MKDEKGQPIKGAHPNARFTAPISQCPSISNRIEHHHGVLISAVIFGGRRAHLAPLVYETFGWQHGVYVGATMASERTAAQFGKLGEVRRDPMAMLPFCGYHMGDYFRHWLEMGSRMKKPPKIFHVNWFRQDREGNYLWPGYSENLRVLEWIMDRVRGAAEARETPIGYIPAPTSIDMTGLHLPHGSMERLLAIDKDEWMRELDDHKEFFKISGAKVPKEILAEHMALRKRLRLGVKKSK